MCPLTGLHCRYQSFPAHPVLLFQADVSSNGISPNSYYLLASVKKPNLGSFKKKITSTSATIYIVPTFWQPEYVILTRAETMSPDVSLCSELESSIRRKDICLKVDQFSACLHSMLICHRKKKFNTVFGKNESQFIFDISSSAEEVLIEVTQQKLHGLDDIWFVIHRVEVNRECKLNEPGDARGIFATEPQCRRTAFSRVSLKMGRYILIPKSSRETNVMIRTHSSLLRETSRSAGDRDWAQKMLARSPAFVTRVLISRVSNLHKPDHVRCESRSLPYTSFSYLSFSQPLIRTAGSRLERIWSAVKSAKTHVTLTLKDFAAFSTTQS